MCILLSRTNSAQMDRVRVRSPCHLLIYNQRIGYLGLRLGTSWTQQNLKVVPIKRTKQIIISQMIMIIPWKIITYVPKRTVD